jgi:Arc/MetJ-type ribon-helix-helix transcriptional regulator
MDDRPRKAEKTRISVTLTRPYVDALDHLVTEGIYLSKGEVVLEGLRLIFRRHGFKPFGRPEGPPEESGEDADLQGGQ